MAIDTKLDDTHYLLKDVTGRTLPGDYHINRIKRAKEVMPDGLVDTYEQLRNHIGLPTDACANTQTEWRSSATNKIITTEKLVTHLRKKEPVANMKLLLLFLLAGVCQTFTPIAERSWVKFRKYNTQLTTIQFSTGNQTLFMQRIF